MIYALFILSSLLLALVAFFLVRRLEAASRHVRQALLMAPRRPYLDALACCLETAVDDSLLTATDAGGLGGLELRYREHQDPYRTVTDLLENVSRKARADETFPFDALVKATYQLSYTLAIPLDRLDPCLGALIEMMQAGAAARAVVRVQKIAPGDLVDPRTMAPVNYGPRVLYPLGLIMYDREGKVLNRGRVICS